MSKHMNGQSIGTTEPLCSCWTARRGAQKWAGKDGWGSHTENQAWEEAGAVKVTDLRAGRRARTKRGLCSRCPPPGAGPHLPGVPLLPSCPAGLEILEDPVGRRKSLEKAPFREQVYSTEG